MSTAVERFDDKARATFDRIGQTEVHEGELLRHRVYTRFLHWMVALFFFLALFSGFGIYLPLAFPLVHPDLWRRTAQSLDAPMVRAGIRFVLRLADAELDQADDLDFGRHEVDEQSGQDRRRQRKNGSARNRLL
jgi:hypothetical protein